MAPQNLYGFLMTTFFFEVKKKRPAGLSEAFGKIRVSFDGAFFQASFVLAGEYWGLQLATVSRTSKM